MSSVGVIEVLIALRMQINAPFCLPSSSQRRPVTPETLAANRRAVDFFVIPGGFCRKPLFFEVGDGCLRFTMAERFLETTRECHQPTAK